MRVALFGWAPCVLRALGRAVAVAVVGTTVSACVAPFSPAPEAGNTDRIEQVLVEAYEEAGEASLDDVALSDMALAGLRNLAAIDPDLAVSETGEMVTLSLGSDPFFSFPKPARNAADDWADGVTKALIAAHQQSWQLQRTEPQQIYDSYMAGLAGTLGDDSRYFPSEEFYAYLYADVDGLVDLTYVKSARGLRVLALDHSGRLAASGLEAGDLITHIDGTATTPLSQFEIYSLIRGPVDSEVVLNGLRDGTAQPFTIVVRRWIIVPRSFELVRHGSILVYKLPILNEFAANELAASLEREVRKAKSENQSLTGLILDLRAEREHDVDAVSMPTVTFGTSRLDWSKVVGYIDYGFMSGPGGSPDAARRLATSFMSDGVVFRRRGRQDTASAVIEAGGTNPSDHIPLVVLVDSSVAGGAEIAAAALSDSGRGLLMGATTAGVGVIRKNVSLHNLGVINVAWANVFAPSGYGLSGRGVLPDICTSSPGLTLESILAGLRRGEGMTNPAARRRHISPEDSDAVAAHRALCPPESNSDDLAHGLGLAILRDATLYARLVARRGGT